MSDRIGSPCGKSTIARFMSINFRRSVTYGMGVLGTALRYRLHKWGIVRCRLFEREGRRLEYALAATALAPGQV